MQKSYLLYLILSLLLVSLIGCAKEETTNIVTPEPEYEIKVTPEGVKYIVDPQKIIGGGPPKDGIPSIDNPKFVSLEEADQ